MSLLFSYIYIPFMKSVSIYLICIIVLSACVSKSKFTKLSTQHNVLIEEKNSLDDVLIKLAIENDSLKKENDILDSLLADEHEKYVALQEKKTGKDSGIKNSKRKKSTITIKDEYEKKAVYMYNICSYVFWPKSNNPTNFIISIVGKSPIEKALRDYLGGKSIHGQPIVIKDYAANDGASVIFLSSNKQNDFAKVKKEIGSKTILYVTESSIYDKAGAHICFYVNGDKINYTVNQNATEKNGLKISPQLLNLAK